MSAIEVLKKKVEGMPDEVVIAITADQARELLRLIEEAV